MKKKDLLIIIILLFIYLILGEYFNIYIPCPIHKLTNFYCPGCGSTRMLKSLLKGNFYQAFRFNPLLFIMLPFFIVVIISDTITLNKNKKSILHKLEPYIWYILIGIFIIYGILRNIPYFDFLKPTSI